MGGFFSSEPVTPLLQNQTRNNHVSNASSISVASSIIRYKPPRQVFDNFERPPNSLDTVYEHDKEREEIPEHPLEVQRAEETEEQAVVPNEVQETSGIIYYNRALEQIQDISNKEFYDLRRVGITPVVVTDDIVLRRQRSMHPKRASKSSTRS